MKKTILTLLLAVMASLGISAQNETVTNQTILDLLKEGFTSQEIIGAVETSSTRTITYDINYMRQLKAAGAQSDLITYVQKIAKTDYGMEGVLWWNTGGKPQKILRSQFEKEQKGFNAGRLAGAAALGVGLGSLASGHYSPTLITATGATAALLGDSGKDIQKLCIMGMTSKNVITTAQPVIRFYLPKHDPASFSKEGGNWYEMIMNEVQSPNEFQLVKMDQKKNRRRFTDGASYSVAGFTGSNSKSRPTVDFTIEEINNNTFEVTFAQPLEPGEYVFFWKNGLSNELFRQHVFGFDFSVQPK